MRLTPRGSFELWRETVRGRSLPWEPWQVSAASNLRRAILGGVRRRAAQLRSLNDQLRDANRAKDEFMAMLGHELRNPLAPISTALQLMRLRGVSTFEKERKVIERQVAHLEGLVGDLMDVSRIAQGKLELKRTQVVLAEVLSEAVEMASPLLELRHHRLTIQAPPGLVMDGDLGRLKQVFSNQSVSLANCTG